MHPLFVYHLKVRIWSGSCNAFRKPLPDVLEDFHMQNELDLQLRQYRSTELRYIVGEATKLRETATDINEALAEVENYLASLKNMSIEVLRCHTIKFLCKCWLWRYQTAAV